MPRKISELLANQDGIRVNCDIVYMYFLCLSNPIKEELIQESLEDENFKIQIQKENKMMSLMQTYLFGSPTMKYYAKIEKFMDNHSLLELFHERMSDDEMLVAKKIAKELANEKKDNDFIKKNFIKYDFCSQDNMVIPSAFDLYIVITLKVNSFNKAIKNMNDELGYEVRKNDEMSINSNKNAGYKGIL